MRRFLSVSDRYRTGTPQGHTSAYQQALAAAAERAGHTFTLAGPAERVAADDPLVTLRLSRRDWPTIAREVAGHLRGAEPHNVLVYEGSVDALAAFTAVAPELDGHTVVMDLFGPGWPLDVPRDGERRGVDVRTDPARRAAALAALAAPLPPNVVVLADTERRAFLARSRGLDVAGVWPTYSILAAPEADLRAADAADAPDAPTPDPAHVVIALSAWQLKGDPGTVRDLDDVLRRASRRTPALRFSHLGGVSDRHTPRRLRARLAALPGAADGPLSVADYAARLAGAGVVWPPKRDQYATQSSGKALDALVAGRPVLLPSGSAGQVEQERWVPGAPSYRSRTELWDLLAELPDLVAPWAAALAAQRDAIRAHYSPDRALDVLVTHAARAEAAA